jgi:hypothetical protein
MVVGVFALLFVSFIIGSMRRPEIPSGTITVPHPEAVGDTLVGPAEYTVDATSQDRWSFFDFSRNAVVTDPGPLDWDLAMRRFYVIVNGGPGFAGGGGVQDLGAVAFDSVAVLPDTGYRASEADSSNPALRRWYDYGWSSHLLRSKSHVYAVRTADGKYAKIAIVSYYCGEARPGCFTFRYVYQGQGSRDVALRSRTPR